MNRPSVWLCATLTIAALTAAEPSSGQRIFTASCAGCHGLDGRGGEHAPAIGPARTDAELSRIIHDGIPAAGMPSFGKLLDGDQIRAVVAWLHDVRSPGDPRNGRALFFGKAHCAQCHATPLRQAAENIREMLAGSDIVQVAVETNSGATYSGVVRNEDNDSLQLQTTDGTFCFLRKSALKTIRRDSPHRYNSALTPAEIEDIIAYLRSS